MFDIKLKVLSFINNLRAHIRNNIFSFFLLNAVFILFQYIYISLRYSFLNASIPFWYSMPWGDLQLASKSVIYLIPIISACLLFMGLLLILLNKFFIQDFTQIVASAVTISNVLLTYSVVRIIKIASVPFQPLISPLYLSLFMPFIIAFLIVYFVLPYFIDYAFRKRLVTNPKLHSHPGMILEKPSARGGGFIYGIVFLLLSFIFVGFNKNFSGFYLSLVMIMVLGLIDDFQNTHPSSTFRLLEKPWLRLLLLFSAVMPIVLSGIKINSVNNPFDGVLDLLQFSINVGGSQVPLLSIIITAFWIVWVLNVLSWSNGIDGQYGGIVGIASLIVSFLALRYQPLEPIFKEVAIMAAISAGAAFGFTKYTWHPSKIMWGFGAMAAGLVLATLSISIKGKIVTSVIIILIPFLDALITVVRRLIQKKNPLAGDKGHLHHLLLARGWSVSKISLFYWASTALLGLIGLLSSDKYELQTCLILAGIVGFFIILLNLLSIKDKQQQQKSEI